MALPRKGAALLLWQKQPIVNRSAGQIIITNALGDGLMAAEEVEETERILQTFTAKIH